MLYTARSTARKYHLAKLHHSININVEKLRRLRLADDIVLIADHCMGDAMVMLEKSYHASLRVGLKITMSKTQIVTIWCLIVRSPSMEEILSM